MATDKIIKKNDTKTCLLLLLSQVLKMQAIYKTNKQQQLCNKLKCMKGDAFPQNSFFIFIVILFYFIFFFIQNVPSNNPGKGRGKSSK